MEFVSLSMLDAAHAQQTVFRQLIAMKLMDCLTINVAVRFRIRCTVLSLMLF